MPDTQSDYTIKNFSMLREIYGGPSEISQNKVTKTLDNHTTHFIESAPFSGVTLYDHENSIDTLLIGGAPGFAKVLDQHHVKLSVENTDGNLDQICKLLSEGNIHVGLIFIIPGIKETVRIKGILEAPFPQGELTSNLNVLIIRMEEGFFHCAKAFIRSKLWTKPEAQFWKGTREFICFKKEAESEVITSFYLKPTDGEPLPTFKPGQYTTISYTSDYTGSTELRTYTLSDRPGLDYYRITVKREPDPAIVSNFLHNEFMIGDKLKLRSPAGKFFLDENSDRPIVLLSGGVGLTPMISMLNHLLAENTEKDIWFLHGAISGRHHAMGEYIRKLSKLHPNLHVHICYQNPEPEDSQGLDYDTKGYLTIDLLEKLLPWRDFDFYLCGPKPFMISLGSGLLKHGVNKERIKWEAFSPDADFTPFRVNTAKTASKVETTSDTSFTIEFRKSNITAECNNNFNSILELAEANNIKARYSCRTGDCHSCAYRILQGSVSYSGELDEEPEEGKVLICSALPKENLIIDL